MSFGHVQREFLVDYTGARARIIEEKVQGSFVDCREARDSGGTMGSTVGVRALPGVVLMGGGGRKMVSRASQHVVGADFGGYNELLCRGRMEA